MVQESNTLVKKGNSIFRDDFEISLSSFVFYLSLFTGFLLFFNILLACSFTFYCKSLPTLSYLGTFPMHDRLFVITLTLAGFLYAIFHLGIYTRIESFISAAHGRAYILTSVISCVSLVAIPVVDEVNGIFIFPIERFHIVVSITFLTSTLASFRLSLEAFERMMLEAAVWSCDYDRCYYVPVGVCIYYLLQHIGERDCRSPMRVVSCNFSTDGTLLLESDL
jgi:hypothetical protein